MSKKKLNLPSFESHFGLIIEQISIVIQKKVLTHLQHEGFEISFNEFLMLMLLASNQEGLSLKEISEKLFKDKSLITRLVNHLENLKLVKRVRSKQDARSYKISITDKGHKTVHSLDEIMVPFERDFIKSIDKKDFKIFNSVLKKLLDYNLLFSGKSDCR